jgi:hypothetical protein
MGGSEVVYYILKIPIVTGEEVEMTDSVMDELVR